MPDDPYCDGGFFIYEPVSHYTDWYNVRGNRLDYSHSTYEYTSYIKVWVPSNGGGAPARSYHEHLDAPAPHGPGSSGHASNHPEEVIWDDDKITEYFTGTADCVYKKLLQKTLTEPGIVQNTYIAFNPDLNFTEYFLTYKLGKLSASITGQTKRLSSLSFEITLNSDLIDNRSPIEIARTILHENIHALLYKHYYNGKDSFIDIFKDYIKKTTGNNLHHSIIAAKYIVPMANALKKYDENRESNIYYTYLAWEGIPDEYRDPNVTDNMIFAARNKFRAKGLKCD